MNFFVTIVRIPFGIGFATLSTLFWWALLIPEGVLFILLIIPASLFMDRSAIKNSWIGKFPNSIRSWINSLQGIKVWVFEG